MKVEEVIALINAITQLAATTVPIVKDSIEAMGSDDPAELDAALARMGAEADRLRATVPAHLRAAAGAVQQG